MANSIDFGTLAVGALIGIGCRKQLKAAGRVAATAAANLASVAAATAQQVAVETLKSPEGQAAEATLQRINQQIDQQLAGSQLSGQGKKGH